MAAHKHRRGDIVAVASESPGARVEVRLARVTSTSRDGLQVRTYIDLTSPAPRIPTRPAPTHNVIPIGQPLDVEAMLRSVEARGWRPFDSAKEAARFLLPFALALNPP